MAALSAPDMVRQYQEQHRIVAAFCRQRIPDWDKLSPEEKEAEINNLIIQTNAIALERLGAGLSPQQMMEQSAARAAEKGDEASLRYCEMLMDAREQAVNTGADFYEAGVQAIQQAAKTAFRCGLPGCTITTDLKLCSGCRKVSYCGVAHQKEHRGVHKKDCVAHQTS